MSSQHHSSPLRSCFGGSPTTDGAAAATAHKRSSAAAAAQPPPVSSGSPNLTTCLYHTSFGLFALTWCRSLFGRSLHLHLLISEDNANSSPCSSTSSSPSFSLHIKPFIFWCKNGSKKLNINNTSTSRNAYVYWDLSRAKFGSGPEPQNGFYIVVVVDGEMVLLVGDSPRGAYSKTKATNKGGPEIRQDMVVRREHVYGNKVYKTKANFGRLQKEISIDCRVGDDDPRLYFTIDNKRVLKIKHLKWKFRGNERIEFDGVHVHVSWDVYNWLFEDDDTEGYALFMFRFENNNNKKFENGDNFKHLMEKNGNNNMILWSQQQCFAFGYETRMMRKGLISKRSGRSSSSSSMSSSSSSCSSSVMEWASVEESELKGPSGFSLMVYAWKS